MRFNLRRVWQRYPMSGLFAASIVTGALFIVMGWHMWDSYRSVATSRSASCAWFALMARSSILMKCLRCPPACVPPRAT